MADAYKHTGRGYEKVYVAPTKTGEDVARAKDVEKLGSTAGAGLGAKGKSGAGMPKQADYASTSEWTAAMRKWREQGQSEQVQGQKAAIKAMGKGKP